MTKSKGYHRDQVLEVPNLIGPWREILDPQPRGLHAPANMYSPPETPKMIKTSESDADPTRDLAARCEETGKFVVDGIVDDPLDVLYDGVELRTLMNVYRMLQQEHRGFLFRKYWPLTPDQRDAVSAHWSAQLRMKIGQSAKSERGRVTYREEDERDE